MKYETAEAFRIALEQRLKNEAEASGMALMRLRKRVAFERFLAKSQLQRERALEHVGAKRLGGGFAPERRPRASRQRGSGNQATTAAKLQKGKAKTRAIKKATRRSRNSSLPVCASRPFRTLLPPLLMAGGVPA